jgi:microcystin degradation protein MlrC
MRIAIGGISHETSTFVNTRPQHLKDFATGFGLFRGQAVIDRFTGSNICAGGFIEGAEKHGYELVPLLWTFAYPSGLIVRQDYELLKQEFLQRLQTGEETGGPVDGVLLDLHGAMVVEGIDDGDGDFIAAVRSYLGPESPDRGHSGSAWQSFSTARRQCQTRSSVSTLIRTLIWRNEVLRRPI